MPASPKEVLWEAHPHTLAKIQILRAYLHAWFQIMGRSQNGKDILYIDGFSGPGSYTNATEGSPLAALSALSAAKQSAGPHWRAGKVHVALIEEDRDRYAALADAVRSYADIPGVFIYLLDSTFEKAMEELSASVPRFFQTPHPLLAFIDPFGVKGFTFASVSRLLASPTSEVLLNFDADGIARVLRAGRAAAHDKVLRAVYGSDEWNSTLNPDSPTHELVWDSMRLYRQRLMSLPRVRYVFPFEMRTHKDSINYFLVFASQHFRGLEKMKEAMKSVDTTGAYRFCDATQMQGELFRFDDVEQYAELLLSRYAGRTVPLDDVRDSVLLDTPFSKPNAVLKTLEQSGRLTVMSRDPARRRGTFKPEDTVSLTFTGVSHEPAKCN